MVNLFQRIKNGNQDDGNHFMIQRRILEGRRGCFTNCDRISRTLLWAQIYKYYEIN